MHSSGVQSKSSCPTRKSRVSTMSTFGPKVVEKDIYGAMDSFAEDRFRKHFQRKVNFDEPSVVTIQDIKDIAIYTTKNYELSPEFISYFHTQEMDCFLRSLVVYFQYYFQVWGDILHRRVEARRKLWQPVVTELENEVRDNLSDLRAMVSRYYAYILVGTGEAKRFHHMNNENNDSLSEKERRLFEMLALMAVKVVWIALFRKYPTLIEKELNRLLRTKRFSPQSHNRNPLDPFRTTPEEDRHLVGKAYKCEKKLLQRSPAIQELILDDHDYRMLDIGIHDIQPTNQRLAYLEIAYVAPEEQLYELGVGVGVLGVERRFLDVSLKPKAITTTRRRTSTMKLNTFNLPPKEKNEIWEKQPTLPKNPCKFQESEKTKEVRKQQCRKWRAFVETGDFVPSDLRTASRVTFSTSFTQL